MSIGGWETTDGSKGLARLLAVEMARAHVRSGHNVIVPQLLGRVEFIETLAELADETASVFHEIMLLASDDDAVSRSEARRAELERLGEPHPLLIAPLDSDSLRATIHGLRTIISLRPRTQVINSTSGDVEGAYRALREAVGADTVFGPDPASRRSG